MADTNPLGALGILATPALQFNDTPESRNCLLIGPTQRNRPGADLPAFERTAAGAFVTRLPVHESANLAFATGGLLGGGLSGSNARAVAVAGPDCTLMSLPVSNGRPRSRRTPARNPCFFEELRARHDGA